MTIHDNIYIYILYYTCHHVNLKEQKEIKIQEKINQSNLPKLLMII